MDTTWKGVIWHQFGAAIDTIENSINACPDSLWGDRSKQPEYWAVVFHTLFYLDYYLSDPKEPFVPPAPFGLEELDPAGVLPPRVYTKAELRSYLEHGREKCRAAIAAMTDETARRPCGFERKAMSFAELLLYTMRHVQHHAAQLNLILRQQVDSSPGWVSQTKRGLGGAS